MVQQRAWVRMPSGKRLDLLNPTPFDWDDADLALGLARTYRWGEDRLNGSTMVTPSRLISSQN